MSYAQESAAHSTQVRQLHDRLREAGIDAVLDQVHVEELGGSEPDWPQWCLDQIKQADFVLVVVSAAYKRRTDSREQLPEDEGRGVYWEARRLRDIIYDNNEKASRILPVLLPGQHASHLPELFNLTTDTLVPVNELSAKGVHQLTEIIKGRQPAPGRRVGGFTRKGWLCAGSGAGRTAAEVHREHFVLRGHGLPAQSRDGDLFQGRVEALRVVTDWLQAEEPPGKILVVTGQPGCGKSAVVARAALELEPAAIKNGVELGLLFHARAATLHDFLHAMRVITRTRASESVSGLLNQVRHAIPEPGRIWRVVVDALDEADADDRDDIVRALTGLAELPSFRIVVATRSLSPDVTSRFVSSALLPQLGAGGESAANLVDLDSKRFFVEADLTNYAQAILIQRQTAGGAWQSYAADVALARRLASAIARRAERNFLVAALTADTLARQTDVVDPSAPEFDPSSLPSTVGEALAKYLSQLEPLWRENVRDLFTVLAYARGDGIPDELWIRFAAALGIEVSRAHLQVLRHSPAADYLIESSTGNAGRVTRLFHQALAEELKDSNERPAIEATIARALLGESSWHEGSDEVVAYRLANLPHHLAQAGLHDELIGTACDDSFLAAQAARFPHSPRLGQNTLRLALAAAVARPDPVTVARLLVRRTALSAQTSRMSIVEAYRRYGFETARSWHSESDPGVRAVAELALALELADAGQQESASLLLRDLSARNVPMRPDDLGADACLLAARLVSTDRTAVLTLAERSVSEFLVDFLSRYLLMLGDLAAAYAVAGFIADPSERFTAYLDICLDLLDRGRVAEAVGLFKGLARFDIEREPRPGEIFWPIHPEAVRALAMSNFLVGRPDKGRRVLARAAFRSDPAPETEEDPPEMVAAQAAGCWIRGDHETAEELFAVAQQMADRLSGGAAGDGALGAHRWLFLARANSWCRRVTETVRCLDRAVELLPPLAEDHVHIDAFHGPCVQGAYVELARIALVAGKPALAMRALSELAARQCGDAFDGLAVVYENHPEYREQARELAARLVEGVDAFQKSLFAFPLVWRYRDVPWLEELRDRSLPEVIAGKLVGPQTHEDPVRVAHRFLTTFVDRAYTAPGERTLPDVAAPTPAEIASLTEQATDGHDAFESMANFYRLLVAARREAREGRHREALALWDHALSWWHKAVDGWKDFQIMAGVPRETWLEHRSSERIGLVAMLCDLALDSATAEDKEGVDKFLSLAVAGIRREPPSEATSAVVTRVCRIAAATDRLDIIPSLMHLVSHRRTSRLAEVWFDYCATHTLADGATIPGPFQTLLPELGVDAQAAGIACAGLARLFPHARSRIIAAVT